MKNSSKILGIGYLILILLSGSGLFAQDKSVRQYVPISLEPFSDSKNHWYGIYDKGNIIQPKANQPTYPESEITKIADNILLYQRSNGGWIKNYDMQAILTSEQADSLVKTKDQMHTTFDNSTTHTHIDYLAQVYTLTKIEKYREACQNGIRFVLAAQYPVGGWPQYFPLEENYSRRITFNDGAYLGIMALLRKIVSENPNFGFVGNELRNQVRVAYDKGLECILNSQIVSNGRLTAWCQQHSEVDLLPVWARAFEPPSICNGESVPVVLFLMGLDKPDQRIIEAVQGAVRWFEKSKILYTKVETVRVTPEKSQYKTITTDRVVVMDSLAPPIWTRFYELGSERPLFSDRNSKFLYSMAEVSLERRNGYAWYTNAPREVLKKYPAWQKKWAPEENVLKSGSRLLPVPRDTSFTPYQTALKIRKEFPRAKIKQAPLPAGLNAYYDIVYKTLPATAYGKRDLHLDLFRPEKKGIYPALLLIHGGGWRSGDRTMENQLAQQIASHGYVTASVEYRLSPEALYPAAIYDIKSAVRFLRSQAKKYSIDPEKIAISGTSAGGQLAALIGMTADVKKFDGDAGNSNISAKIQAIIDIDGVLDFRDPNESAKDNDPLKPSAGAMWFGGDIKQVPEKWEEASPVVYAGKNTPPILFVNSALPRFHAGRDSVITILNKHKIYTEVHTIPDTPHPFWLFDPWFEPTVNYMAAFLEKVLK